MRHKIFIFVLLLFYTSNCVSQQKVLDSLTSAIKTVKQDTTRCDILLLWGEIIYYEFPDSSVILWKKAKALVEKNISADPQNRKLYLMRQANALNDLGTVYHYQGKIDQALDHLYGSLKVLEELKDKQATPIIISNIGTIYFDQENYTKALECYQRSLKIHEQNGDKRGMGTAYNNIASIYDHQKNQTLALEYLMKGLGNYEAIGYERGIANSYHNIAGIYKDKGKNVEALEYFNKSLALREKLSDKEGVASVLNNIAQVKLATGNLAEALAAANGSMKEAKTLGYPANIGNAAGTLKKIYQKQNKFKEAFEMYELEMTMKDSIRNEETKKSTLKKELLYDFEKKEAVAKAEHESELRNQELIAAEKARKQELITLFVVIGLVLVLFFSGFVVRSLRITRKQKALIEHQKQMVEEHQKEVIDSIHYAKRIQQSLLPTEKYIYKTLDRLKQKKVEK